MVTLRQLAYQQLCTATVTISPPIGYSGTVWNNGEIARVKVTVINTTGLPLRDVVVTLRASGAARVYPIWIWDGDMSWDEIEPGQSKAFWVYLKAIGSGTATLLAHICAEIVPYACKWKSRRDDRVWPA